MPEQTIKDLKKELYLAMHKTQEMLDLTEDGFTKNKLSSLAESDTLAEEVHMKEDALIAAFAKMASTNSEARSLLCVPSHIENIMLSIKRITENSRSRVKEGLLFSDKALQETVKLFTTAKNALKKAGEAMVTGAEETTQSALMESDAIARMSSEFATAHEERLVTGQCQPKASSLYVSMLYAFEDMSTHIKYSLKKVCVR